MGEQEDARLNGGVAQLGEHLPCKQGVKSSNLSISTLIAKRTSADMETCFSGCSHPDRNMFPCPERCSKSIVTKKAEGF